RCDDPDDETGEVVVAKRVEARHLGGLAAEKRAAGVATGFAHALDELLEDVGVELARREVVKEEDRTRARARDVIDTVVDDVDADPAMFAGRDRDLDLGADAVGAGGE